MHNGRSRSSKVIDIYTNRKLSINFLLVINSNLVVSGTVFEIGLLTLKGRKWLILPTPPLFEAPARGNPLEFRDETYPRKTRGMGLLYGENCVILASTVFDWSTRVTDKQTDRQTDGIAMTYTRYSIYAVARKNGNLSNNIIFCTGLDSLGSFCIIARATQQKHHVVIAAINLHITHIITYLLYTLCTISYSRQCAVI